MTITLTPKTSSQGKAPVAKIEMVMQVLDDESQVEFDVVDCWRNLTDNPMGGPDWLLPWWKHYGTQHDQLQLVLFFENSKLVSIAPLYLENGKNLKLLGSGKVCSDHSELLVGSHHHVMRAQAMLLNWLMQDQSPNWQSLQLQAINPASLTTEIADQWQNQISVWREPGEPVCMISLPNSWEEYVQSLSKNHRKRVRRWTRQHLESEQVEVRSTDSGWDYDEAYDCLVHLHNLRRATMPEKGAFEEESFMDFHKEAFGRLADNGLAVITGIFSENQPVAIEYELCNQDRVFAYQSGADLSGSLSSPGSVSILARIKTALARGKKVYDLMRGDEEYKYHWNAQCERTVNFMIWPQNWRGTLAANQFHAKRKLKSCVKSMVKKFCSK